MSRTEIPIVGRRYKKMFLSTSAGTTIAIETAVTWPTNAPGSRSDNSTTPTNNTSRNVSPSRLSGPTGWSGMGQEGWRWRICRFPGLRVTPDGSNNGAFEISGLPGGSTDVYVIPTKPIWDRRDAATRHPQQ